MSAKVDVVSTILVPSALSIFPAVGVVTLIIIPSVPVSCIELFAVSVLPSTIVNVLPVAGTVKVILLNVVAPSPPVLELNVREVLFIGCNDCVPLAVMKRGKHVVSVASLIL